MGIGKMGILFNISRTRENYEKSYKRRKWFLSKQRMEIPTAKKIEYRPPSMFEVWQKKGITGSPSKR